MKKRKSTFRGYDPRKPYLDLLDSIPDTQSTAPSAGQYDGFNQKDYEDVPPPFKSTGLITTRDFNISFKTVCIAASIVVIVIIPAVIYFNDLHNNIKTISNNINSLRIEFTDLTKKMEKLWEDSILQRAKIEAMEKYSFDGNAKDHNPRQIIKK